MTNHKKPKRVKKSIKQKYYTTKGKDPLTAVSTDLLLQQDQTSTSIKNYNTAGIAYDKRIYNKLVQNMEAQKIASQSNDADLKIKLKNYGDDLRNDLKKSAGKKIIIASQEPQERTILRREPQERTIIRRPPQDYALSARIQVPGTAQNVIDPFTPVGLRRSSPSVITQNEGSSSVPVVVNATDVDHARAQILDKLKQNKYDTKRPKDSTIRTWAKTYGLSKGQVKTIVSEDYDSKLNRDIARLDGQRSRAAAVKSAPKEMKVTSAVAKNKIIRSKLADLPPNKKLTPSVKQRLLNLKNFKDNNISMEDIDKVIKSKRKK